jgi:hypothetical protein
MIIEGDYDEDTWFGEVRIDGVKLDPVRSQALRNMSPDGFSWSYAGSGPAQLALAILLEAGVPERVALVAYPRFAVMVIMPLPRATFRTEVDIDKWLHDHEPTLAIGSDPTA